MPESKDSSAAPKCVANFERNAAVSLSKLMLSTTTSAVFLHSMCVPKITAVVTTESTVGSGVGSLEDRAVGIAASTSAVTAVAHPLSRRSMVSPAANLKVIMTRTLAGTASARARVLLTI